MDDRFIILKLEKYVTSVYIDEISTSQKTFDELVSSSTFGKTMTSMLVITEYLTPAGRQATV